MRIALVGLAASEVLIVKNYFSKYADAAEIIWTNVRERDFDTLIIRARFLETPEIELLVNNAGPHVAVLAIYRNDQLGQEAINQNIPSLKIPSYDKEDIIDWVASASKPRTRSRISMNATEEVQTKTEIPQPANEVDEKQLAIEKGLAKLSATGAKLNDSTKKSSATSPNHPQARHTRGFSNQEMLKAIKENLDLTCHSGELKTWIKTDRRRVFCNYELGDIPGYDTFEWEKTSLTALPAEATRQVELNQWLWESLWKSELDFKDLVDETSLYQLKRWPQPKSKAHRSEPLRIAAQIQKRAMTMSEIVSATQIDDTIIRKFVYSMQVVGFIKKVKAEQVKPAVKLAEKLEPKTAEVSAQEASKRSLLKQLRNRLGL